MRSYDAKLVAEAVKLFRKTEEDFDPIEWISDMNNILVQNLDGDAALLEYEKPGVFTAHYYFKSRGKEAVSSARSFLDEVFNSGYNVEVIRGFTPLAHLGARWMNRKIGLKSHGVVKIFNKPYELFIISKKEYTL